MINLIANILNKRYKKKLEKELKIEFEKKLRSKPKGKIIKKNPLMESRPNIRTLYE